MMLLLVALVIVVPSFLFWQAPKRRDEDVIKLPGSIDRGDSFSPYVPLSTKNAKPPKPIPYFIQKKKQRRPMSSWIRLEKFIDRFKSRRFAWIADSNLKYIVVRIDTRDDHAIIYDRDMNVIARTEEELDSLFDRLNKLADEHPAYSIDITERMGSNNNHGKQRTD